MRWPLLVLSLLLLGAFAYAQGPPPVVPSLPDTPAVPDAAPEAPPAEPVPVVEPALETPPAAEGPVAEPIPEPVSDANAADDNASEPAPTGEAAPKVQSPGLLDLLFSSNTLAIASLLLFVGLTVYLIKTDREP